MQMSVPSVAFPHPDPPAPGEVIELAPGVLWARLALPFRLNHVNIYLIRDGAGWVAVDTGIADDNTRAAWEALLSGPLRGEGLSALVVTHFHPDHVGLAGWLTARFGIKLHMPRTEYLFSAAITHQALGRNPAFYESHGLSAEAVDRVTGKGHGYLRMTTGLPGHFHRLVHGGRLTIGDRVFDVLTGGGHAPEQAMLYCAEDKLFLSADQVLTRISPNISTESYEPESNPLGEFLASLTLLRRDDPARCAGSARPPCALYRPACAHRRIDRPSRQPLRTDRGRLPDGTAKCRRSTAGAVRQAARSAADELCVP